MELCIQNVYVFSTLVSIDAVHTFMLRSIKKEVELLLGKVSEHYISDGKVKLFLKRLKTLKVPSDIARLPTSFCDKASFGEFTAHQFKNFEIMYARLCFHGLISQQYYKNIVLLAEAIELAYQTSIYQQEVDKLAATIMEHHKGFAKLYGKWGVSVNFRMGTHIPENRDLGPCPGFWYFAFEMLSKHFVLKRVDSDPLSNSQCCPPRLMALVEILTLYMNHQ